MNVQPVIASPTTAPALPTVPSRGLFPRQPVHPRLAARLYLETQRLHSAWREANLPDGMDSLVVALALKGLEGREASRCLDPWRSSELDALLKEGVLLVRYWWKKTAKRHIAARLRAREEGRHRPVPISLESLVGDSRVPRVDLYGGRGAGSEYRDFLSSEIGRSVQDFLIQDCAIEEGRAIVFTLELFSGDMLPDIHQAVEKMHYTLPSYVTLRKWLERTRPRLLPRLREACLQWGIAPSDSQRAYEMPNTSQEVFGIDFFGETVDSPFSCLAFARSHSLSPRGLRPRNAGDCSTGSFRSFRGGICFCFPASSICACPCIFSC